MHHMAGSFAAGAEATGLQLLTHTKASTVLLHSKEELQLQKHSRRGHWRAAWLQSRIPVAAVAQSGIARRAAKYAT
jgi:hypothetical protein